MGFDREEVDGSNPFGPTIVFNHLAPSAKFPRNFLPVISYLCSLSRLFALRVQKEHSANVSPLPLTLRCTGGAVNKQPVYAAVALCLLSVAFTQNSTELENHGIVVANMDRSVKPGDDFYQYANGTWIKRTEIPPDRDGVSGATPLRDKTDKRVADLIADAARQGAATGDQSRRIADLFKSYMDEVGIGAKGLSPLRPHLDAILAIHDKRDLARALGESLRADVDGLDTSASPTANLFGLWVAPGFNDPEHYTPYLLQGGLELPDREYYLSQSAQMREIRSKYQTHVAAMLNLAEFGDADARAARVIELEHAIAEKHLSIVESNELQKGNNTWKTSDFATKAPGLDWAEYFRGAGLSQQGSFIVRQPTAFAGESSLVASAALETWKDWLAFHLIEGYAVGLPKAFSDEHFAFFGKILSGTPEQPARWKRGIELVNQYLGDDVGRLYVQRYFSPEAKAQVEAMVANIVLAFHKRIEALTWMDSVTKAEAQAKLDSLYVGVGYGESWHDYWHDSSGYEVKADDIFGNLWRGDLSAYHRQVARLGGRVDRKEWYLTPQTVDAAELPTQNALNFPAAILQPPAFDPQAPTVVNYASIGAVIGHEISHTFDTEGSAFDRTGRMRNWWKPADLGGISAAYDAYRASLPGQVAPFKDGLSGDQQFFLAYGQFWRGKYREAALRRELLKDVHAPHEFRALTVRNLDAWYAAFDVKPGDKLYLAPADRVRIW